MNRASLLAVLLSVSLGVGAQLLLKAGVSTPAVTQALATGQRTGMLLSFALSPLVWLGLFVYGTSAIVWLFVLAKVDVGLAYPFVGLGFVLTMLLGWMLYGEALSVARVLGALLIVAGVVVLARS
jgi:multidrug transporter EmrE-like cation transporter